MDKHKIIGIALIVVAAGAVGGACWWKDHEAAQGNSETSASLLAAADQARADQIRTESAAARAVADAGRTGRLDQRTAQALEQLASSRPMAQCDGALQLGRLGAREHVAALADVVTSFDRASSVRVCAASALVTLGDRATAMRWYTEWADSSDDTLKRAALMGFGEIGPSAAAVGIPHLTEALRSPYMDLRYLAVDALSKLGAAAVPLLEQASKDTDKHVREYAERSLKNAGVRR